MIFRILPLFVAASLLLQGCGDPVSPGDDPSPVVPDDPDGPDEPSDDPDSDIDESVPEGDIQIMDCTVRTSSGKSKCSVDFAGRKIYVRHIADLRDITDVEFTFGMAGVKVPDKIEKFCEGVWPEKCRLQFKANGKGSIYDFIFTDYIPSDDPDLAPSDTWKIAWADEFNGPDLDINAWDRVTTPNEDNGGWNAFMGDAEDLVQVRKGRLVLVARENPSPVAGTPLAYATGGIRGEYKVYRKLGRCDIKARMNKDVHGYWPAIWFMPGGQKGQTVPRLEGGEIDLLEYYNGTAYQTVHTKYNNDGQSDKQESQKRTYNFDPSVYHIYSVEVTDRKLVMYIDGEKKLTVNKLAGVDADQCQFPFHDVPHGLILSSQLGSSNCAFSSNFIPVDGFGLPAYMEVDYVRYYDEVK